MSISYSWCIILQTPLHSACRDNKTELVALLLQHQAKWWLPDARGDTALELAVAANSHDAMIIIQTFAKDTGVQTILRNLSSQ